MIKTLQKKFMITAMAAITVLLVLLLGAINIANIVSVSKETDNTLNIISDSEGDSGKLQPIEDNARPGMPNDFNYNRNEKNDYDTFMSSNFFVVHFSASGEAVKTDVSRTSTVSEANAVQLAQQVIQSDKIQGKTGRYRFKTTNSADGGKVVVFLDTSNEMLSYLRVLAYSVIIGIVCWGFMFVFVFVLSKKAIRPIAENIERQKQFITNAGHEIKTPIAIIQANTEAMELYNGENKWSKNIKTQTTRLGGLMNDMLFLARMDESGVEANITKFNLGELLENSINGFLQSAENENIELVTDIAPDVALNGDRSQLEQFFSIMLDNAVKYVNVGGKIKISLRQSDRHIKIEFFNTCDELPDVKPEKLFERFYRADKARTQKSGGYGIGLSVASSIVEANKGTLTAEYIDDGIRFTAKFKK